MNNFTSFGKIGAAACVPVPIEAPIAFDLPFDSKTEAVCTHAHGSGSHSAADAFYAIDLATDYQNVAATVRAAADGTAYVLLGEDGKLCPEPPGTPANAQGSSCGNSWGNRVLILHPNGFASFYVHLDHPLVSNGTLVHKGDPIGIEGWTGAAGHRHVHWSVQRIPGSIAAEWISHISQGWVGESVPFHFSARQGGLLQNFDVASIECAHANIGSAPSDQQPRFTGVR